MEKERRNPEDASGRLVPRMLNKGAVIVQSFHHPSFR
jgi:hypothetical protein